MVINTDGMIELSDNTCITEKRENNKGINKVYRGHILSHSARKPRNKLLGGTPSTSRRNVKLIGLIKTYRSSYKNTYYW